MALIYRFFMALQRRKVAKFHVLKLLIIFYQKLVLLYAAIFLFCHPAQSRGFPENKKDFRCYQGYGLIAAGNLIKIYYLSVTFDIQHSTATL